MKGTMKLCEEIIQKRTGKMTEEEWQEAERAQTSGNINQISDEEIETAANGHFEGDLMWSERIAFKLAIRWYRDKLKKPKNEIND
jgi:hypothetical protein